MRNKQGATELPGYGLSQVVPFIPGEDFRERHHRRYVSAAQHREKVKQWCCVRSISFTSKRFSGCNYQRWEFRAPGKFLNWTPHLGRMMAKPDIKGVVYIQRVYDWEQLLSALEQWFTRSEMR